MKKRNFLFLLIIGIALFSILPACGGAGGEQRIELCGTGWIINEFTGECLGETDYIVTGQVENELFSGYIQVESYRVPMRDIAFVELLAVEDGEYLEIFYAGNTFVVEDGTFIPEVGDYAYWVYYDTKRPESTILHVSSWDDSSQRYYIVPGESDADALARLTDYLTKRFGEEYPLIGS